MSPEYASAAAIGIHLGAALLPRAQPGTTRALRCFVQRMPASMQQRRGCTWQLHELCVGRDGSPILQQTTCNQARVCITHTRAWLFNVDVAPINRPRNAVATLASRHLGCKTILPAAKRGRYLGITATCDVVVTVPTVTRTRYVPAVHRSVLTGTSSVPFPIAI